MMEPTAIKHLADAATALQAARRVTGLGPVDDHCANALREVASAIRCAAGEVASGDDHPEGGEVAVDLDGFALRHGSCPGEYTVHAGSADPAGSLKRVWWTPDDTHWIAYRADNSRIGKASSFSDAFELLIADRGGLADGS